MHASWGPRPSSCCFTATWRQHQRRPCCCCQAALLESAALDLHAGAGTLQQLAVGMQASADRLQRRQAVYVPLSGSSRCSLVHARTLHAHGHSTEQQRKQERHRRR